MYIYIIEFAFFKLFFTCKEHMPCLMRPPSKNFQGEERKEIVQAKTSFLSFLMQCFKLKTGMPPICH